jgi:hypothetical protein
VVDQIFVDMHAWYDMHGWDRMHCMICREGMDGTLTWMCMDGMGWDACASNSVGHKLPAHVIDLIFSFDLGVGTIFTTKVYVPFLYTSFF